MLEASRAERGVYLIHARKVSYQYCIFESTTSNGHETTPAISVSFERSRLSVYHAVLLISGKSSRATSYFHVHHLIYQPTDVQKTAPRMAALCNRCVLREARLRLDQLLH